jgi:hypothetical protein
MDDKQLQDLLAQAVPAITAKLPELDRDTLVQLQAAEVAGGNRVTLLGAIDERLKALDADEGGEKPPAVAQTKPGDTTTESAGAGAGKGEPAAQAAGKLTPKDWQHPDYAGALNGEQAAWRIANIKPAAAVRRK